MQLALARRGRVFIDSLGAGGGNVDFGEARQPGYDLPKSMISES
jgi:hypothetical protein